MNIELISPYEKYTSILEQVMRNRKIDMNNYLYLNDECLISPWKLDNIDLASEIYLKHCENNSKVLVVVDSDCDGYTSAAAIFNYTLLAFPEMLENLDFVVHENKTHGIIINDEILSKYNLIIVPDAGSNDT
jgi:single-stranded-DNA-specific exonuclease